MIAALLYMVCSVTAAVVDDPIRTCFYGMRSAWLDPVVRGFTHLGDWGCITALCIILILIPATRKQYGIPVSATAIFVTILNKTIKTIVQRPRPDDILWLVPQGGFSFPSGHSITSMAVFGLMLYLIRHFVKKRAVRNVLTAVMLILMFGIGLSRIYVGVHYPTDVLAGWCLGYAVLSVLAATDVFGFLKKENSTAK